MNLLVFSTLYPNVSQPNFGIFVENSVRHVAASGIATTVVAPNGVPPWPLDRLTRYRALADLPEAETWRGLDVRRPRFQLLPAIGWRFNPAAIVRAARPVLHRLRAEGFVFDAIDAQFFYPCGVAAVQLAREFNVPVTIKARGSDIALWGQRPAARRAILWAAGRAQGITAVSEKLKGEIEAMGVPDEKIGVHYTAVDLDNFAPGDRQAARAALAGELGLEPGPGCDSGRPLIVSVGSLTPVKDFPLLLNALRQVPAADLLIAGHGPERAALEQLAGTLGLGARVRFLGAIAHDRLPLLYRAADLFALASQREGLANVWIEALASGTPVVTTDVGGAREVIDRPEAGRVAAARTPEALAAAINDVLAMPVDPQAARASAERFSWARHVSAKRAHLERLVAGH